MPTGPANRVINYSRRDSRLGIASGRNRGRPLRFPDVLAAVEVPHAASRARSRGVAPGGFGGSPPGSDPAGLRPHALCRQSRCRGHCCIWPEGATGGEQSGADSRPDGCQKCSKRSILGIADGVQLLWWRTPVLVIGRCNSASRPGEGRPWDEIGTDAASSHDTSLAGRVCSQQMQQRLPTSPPVSRVTSLLRLMDLRSR
jgi:hypothetical protein